MQPPRKRPRPSSDDGSGASETRVVTKRKSKGRQTAGLLSGLMNMPLDVFFELCGSAHAKWVDYAIRLRLCKACYKANILKGSAILEEENAEMLYLVPCETGSDYKKAQQLALPPNRTSGNKYYAVQVIDTLNKILILHREDREATANLLKEMLDDVTTRHIAAVMTLAWLREESLLKELTNKEIMSNRKSKITERLRDLGYTEDEFPEGKEAWDKLVDQAKPLTDRIWSNIRPKLEEQLTVEKERRSREALENRVKARLIAVCRICKGLMRKTPLQVRRHLRYMRLAEQPEEIVWHLRCFHRKAFEKRDVLFISF